MKRWNGGPIAAPKCFTGKAAGMGRSLSVIVSRPTLGRDI